MRMQIPFSKIKRLLGVTTVVVAAITVVFLIYGHIEETSSSVAFHGKGRKIARSSNNLIVDNNPAIRISQKEDDKGQKKNIGRKLSPPISLAAELASISDDDVGQVAKISQQALSCQARRKTLKEKNSLEQEIATAKTEGSRTLLQKHYESILPAIRLAEANTDDQCDSLSDSELDIVARESTLRAAALGDSDSQMCAMSVLPEVFAVSDDEQRNAIGQQVEDYLSAGLARGDWRAVRLMQRACSQRAGVARLGLSCDGLSQLRMQVILGFGATGEERSDIMANVARTISDANMHGGLQLQGKVYSQAEVNNAVTWAKGEYTSHFQNSPYDYNEAVCNSGKS